MNNTNATIVTIGDELLIGQVVDTNSAWIAQQLNKIGIAVLRRVAVGDTKDAIVAGLDEELPKVDILILTGGLGPTSDDITKPLLAEYFGSELVVNEQVLEHIKSLFTSRNRPFIERNMKQAEVPANCKVLFNRMGTAPGMWFEKDGKIIISLPGVPFEMKTIMAEEVLRQLMPLLPLEAIEHKTIFTAGEGESFIAEKLVHLEADLPSYIKLAYLPDAGMVRLRLTGTGENKEQILRELTGYQGRIAAILGDIVIALEDLPMEKILGDALSSQHKTLALAESCTGGFISHSITQIPGASAYYIGGIVCYHLDVKMKILGVKAETLERYGAVSEQTAVEMASGVLNTLHTDVALAVTGLLGPDGDGEAVPIGTVWVAYGDKNTMHTKRFKFPYDRERNKEMASKNAMLLMWRFIKGKI